MPEVIADTSPLQYLYQTDLLDLLHHLYGRVAVPQAVARELAEGLARGISLPDINAIEWVRIVSAPGQELLPLAADLGAGEREVLALAASLPDALALVDDALARRHAQLLGVAFTGTLGVLLRAKESGHLDAVAPALERLDAARFRLDPATRAAVLELAGE